jgi:hypothetical protein
MSDYFVDLLYWSPNRVKQHIRDIDDDSQLLCYFRKVLKLTAKYEHVGEVLTADQLESLWRSTFSKRAQREIWLGDLDRRGGAPAR